MVVARAVLFVYAPLVVLPIRLTAGGDPATPVTIAKKIDMTFDYTDVPVSSTGIIVLSASGLLAAIATSGTLVPSNTGHITAAEFNVSGLPQYTYSITLPAEARLSDGRDHSMSVGSFISTPSGAGLLGRLGTQDIKVGATFVIGERQAAGCYTNSTDVQVTVNYN